VTRLRALAVCVAACVAFVAGCGDSSPPTAAKSGETTSVKVLLDWFVNADHAGLVAAVDHAGLAQRNIAAKLVVPSDPASALTQVAAGRADFAVSYESDVLIARSKGIPVVAVGAVISRPLNAIITRADRGIRSPKDLEGKTVGAAGVPSDRALLDRIVRSDGGDPSKVTLRGIGYTLTPALAAGKVDAVIGAYWNIEVPELQKLGVATRVLKLDESGVPTHDELVLVTSDKTIVERGAMVRTVVQGLAEGQTWASLPANRAAVVGLLKKRNADLNAAVLPRQVALTAPVLSTDMAVKPAEWATYAAWMRTNKLLAGSSDTAAAVNETFLP
jgi:putative hydroxymethylpyrimidine transport system substrate-binding protein